MQLFRYESIAYIDKCNPALFWGAGARPQLQSEFC